MRPYLICFVLLLLAAPRAGFAESAPRIEVEISESEVLSLYYFAQAAMGDAHKNPKFGEIWSEHATDEAKAGLQLFGDSMLAGTGNLSHYTRSERPTQRYVGTGLDEVLEAQAGASTSLDDFGVRMTGLLPVGAQADFMAGLKAIAPLHREHVWNPTRSFMKSAERGLNRAARKYDLERRFGQAARFYGAAWPENVPIRIYLVGIPGRVERMNAHSAGPIGVVEVVRGDDLDRRLAVVFHELCHSLYKAQPVERQVALEKVWTSHPLGPQSGLAYSQINEGLATALGNGWFREVTLGRNLAENSWYADPIVDRFAKSLYPVLMHYLDHGRVMDEAFVNYAVARFVVAFPHATRDPRIIFRSVFIGAGKGLARRSAVRAAQRGLGATSIWSGQPLGDERTLSNYARRLTTILVVRPDDALEELSAYPETVRAALRPALTEPSPFALIVDANGVLHVVAVVDDDAQMRPLFDEVSSVDRLDHGDVIRPR